MKKYFLTTALMGTFIAPAFGADKIITSANTCTVDVLGVSDNNAVANTIATWDLIDYECPAGQYLDETTLNCIECPTGSYCPGGTFTVEANNSKTACPADYTSDVAATAESECYMGCSVNCTQQPVPNHAINVTHGSETANGKLYYGGSCDANTPVCSMDFKCITGYHKRPDLTDEQIVTIITKMMGVNPEDVTPEMLEQVKIEFFDNWEILEGSASSDPEFQQLVLEINNVQHPDNQSKSLIQPYIDLAQETQDVISADGGYGYIKSLDGIEECYTFNNLVYMTIELLPGYAPAEFNVIDCDIMEQQISIQHPEFVEFRQSADEGDWFYGILSRGISMYGESRCFGSNDSFLPQSRTVFMQGIPVQSEWSDSNDVPMSEESCSGGMGLDIILPMLCIQYPDVFDDGQCSYLAPLYTTYTNPNAYITYMCDTNTINIDWNPDNNGAHIKNMCTYDGSITVPSDPVKPGYTFMGWKLLENTTTE